MADEERHRDLLDHSVEVHLVGELDERVQVRLAPDPQHVLPVVRHRPLAFVTGDLPAVELFRDDWLCLVSADDPEVGSAITLDQPGARG
ncbi:MAG TPA: hypothetical protein VHZ03_40995 [Trebonia sp.]|nr:hypothetical protein [Trebonia sp.]